jgi:cytoskeletal protein CcmA (bactofilin family)
MTGALVVQATISGSRLIISGNANITGALLAVGNITSRGTVSGSILHASTQLRSSGSLVVNGNGRFKSTITILGTASGNILHAEKSLSTSGSLVFEGTASGANLYVATSLNGAGLVDCDVAGSSKLLWDSTTGRFSCGTDQTGGSAGTAAFSGAVLALGDARYVRKAGDTMTGTLAIRPLAGTTTVGLNVAATMSGRNLYVSGTGTSPLLVGDVTNARVGIGIAAP